MYPYLRLFQELRQARKASSLPLTGTHVSNIRCWPQDIDPWRELNNGRTLTLYDLGRVPLGVRTGLTRVVQEQGWGMTVAGSSTRYRKRVRIWDVVEMRSRCVGWDHRFFYMDQSMWKDGDCTGQILVRNAVTSKEGIIAPDRVLAAMGQPGESPALPAWIQGWIDSDALRPWPPER